MKRLLRFLASVPLIVPTLCHACWHAAGDKYGISPTLLNAIGVVESNLNPLAVNRSHYHKTRTYDIGLMQINASKKVMANLKLTQDDLLDPCTNIHVGARILHEKFIRFGVTWEAVGAYNASCTTLTKTECQSTRKRYAWRVYRAQRRLESPGLHHLKVQSNYVTPAQRQRALRHQPRIVMVNLNLS